MPQQNSSTKGDQLDSVVAEARRDMERRQKSYRERALKMYPHVCGRCGREFEGKKLKELTVHHRDHNHDNNPPDGSNWELLCFYCHDNEHSRNMVADCYSETTPGREKEAPDTFKPFAGLEALLKKKD